MGIRLNGSTSGYVELTAPAVAGTTTLELPTDSIKPGLVLVTTQSFSAASSVSVNNCFTSAYDHYKVMATYSAASGTDVNLFLRARNGGVDDAGASNYAWQQVVGFNGASAAGDGAISDSGIKFGFISTGAQAEWAAQELSVLSPNLPRRTVITGTRPGLTSGSVAYMGAVGGWYKSATAHDGFTIYPSSGTITGSLYVYGYRKA